VREFNKKERPRELMAKPWKLSEGVDYQVSMPDEGLGEGDPFGEGDTKFPHTFDKLSPEQKLDAIRTTPYGNELLADFALDLLAGEKLGEGRSPDLLAISFSSPDYIGHVYGPNSMEVMDNYLKLDRQIARLLDALDAKLGKGNYLFFLTADHGVKPNEAYLSANRVFNGTLSSVAVRDSLKAFCLRSYGDGGVIETVADNHIYLSQSLIQSKELDPEDVEEDIVRYLRYTFSAMGAIFTRMELASQTPKRDMSSFTLNGFHHFRSGDITFELAVNHMTYEMSSGTSHGAPYPYDTHVPLLFFGWQVPAGSSNRLVYIEDIAPTLANLIGIQEPNGCIGVPLLPTEDK
jgi:predicted AlkP superfamily pyrophosphatase or phosphodiesterase